jgi:hypothetical protein
VRSIAIPMFVKMPAVTRATKPATVRETMLALILVLGAGLLNFHTEIIDEYRWNKEIEIPWTSVGWVTIARRPAPKPLFPWTMIWKPAGMITLAHPVLTKKRYQADGSGAYLISTIVSRFFRDDRGHVESSQSAELINCSAKTYATAGDVKEKKRFTVLGANGSPVPGQWRPVPAEIFTYFCAPK